jgi:NADPH:quinone reductase-like Zn-dependent oxidoreductase
VVEGVGSEVTAFQPGDRVFGQFMRLPEIIRLSVAGWGCR